MIFDIRKKPICHKKQTFPVIDSLFSLFSIKWGVDDLFYWRFFILGHMVWNFLLYIFDVIWNVMESSFIEISYLFRLISSNFANGFGNKRARIRWIPCIFISSDVCNDCLFRDGVWILSCWCSSINSGKFKWSNSFIIVLFCNQCYDDVLAWILLILSDRESVLNLNEWGRLFAQLEFTQQPWHA